jgi:hypothetical protein
MYRCTPISTWLSLHSISRYVAFIFSAKFTFHYPNSFHFISLCFIACFIIFTSPSFCLIYHFPSPFLKICKVYNGIIYICIHIHNWQVIKEYSSWKCSTLNPSLDNISVWLYGCNVHSFREESIFRGCCVILIHWAILYFLRGSVTHLFVSLDCELFLVTPASRFVV